MSQSHKITIDCPKCHAKGEFEVWDSINVDLNPELRTKLFNNELFEWTCPDCGECLFIPVDTLYHDMSNKFMLFYSYECSDIKNKYTPLKLPQVENNIDADYTLRVVYGYRNLKEKIRILEDGLNDIVVERMKHALVSIHDELRGMNLLYGGIVNENSEYGEICFIYYGPDNKREGIAISMEMYFETKLAISVDSRFKTEGCICIDGEWVSNQMKLLK